MRAEVAILRAELAAWRAEQSPSGTSAAKAVIVPISTPEQPPPNTTKGLVARRLLYPLKEVAQLLGTSRPTLYSLYHAGRLELVRIDGRTYVRASELERYAATEGGPPQLRTETVRNGP